MSPTIMPIEAIAGLWEIIACVGTVLAASVMWMIQPR